MKIIEQMARRNPIYKHLDLKCLDAGPGHARFVMDIRPELGNTFQFCHGGIIFTLADIAFGFTCNATHEKAVTAGATIDYIAPGRMGERLIAQASETHCQGRNAFYDVKVSNQDGTVIALVRGRMRIIGGPAVEDHTPTQ